MAMWVYLKSEPNLYTVGFYDPQGGWEPESDWLTSKDAAKRVRYLNGSGSGSESESELLDALQFLLAEFNQHVSEDCDCDKVREAADVACRAIANYKGDKQA